MLTLTWGIDILFEKLTQHAKPVFFFDNFSGDLYLLL